MIKKIKYNEQIKKGTVGINIENKMVLFGDIINDELIKVYHHIDEMYDHEWFREFLFNDHLHYFDNDMKYNNLKIYFKLFLGIP